MPDEPVKSDRRQLGVSTWEQPRDMSSYTTSIVLFLAEADFSLVPAGSRAPNTLTLQSPPSSNPKIEQYTYTLSLITPYSLRITLTSKSRPLPPHANLLVAPDPIALPDSYKIDEQGNNASFTLVDGKEVTLSWSDAQSCPVLEIHELVTKENGEKVKAKVFSDLPNRAYLETRDGVGRYTRLDARSLHLGLGEKGAPMDLTGRAFKLSGTDAAAYDAYVTDPLYKHTPYLISAPRPPNAPSSTYTSGGVPPPAPISPIAIFHTTNSDGAWNIGKEVCDPWGQFKSYTQDHGGLEEILIMGSVDAAKEGVKQAGVREIVWGFAELVGRPLLAPRDWLGYLASGMGLGESDEPIAQELLEDWPEECKKYDIPCSAIHLSSGYTVGDDGNRYVFGMNKKRYPDFKAMVHKFHESGIKVCPNIKPYVLETHPDYARLKAESALFFDPYKNNEAVQTMLWSSGVGSRGRGSWVDMTSPAGRNWWAEGVRGLIKDGCDTMWNDNNEFLQHNDAYLCANTPVNTTLHNATEGPTPVGLMGRMIHTQIMAQTSKETLLEEMPDRRPFVLTRSGNVGTLQNAGSSWSGDNFTSWKTLQGSVAMGLNAGLSLMQSYGTDVGGFCGPLPGPELFTRWVQYGCTNSRFCIHSYKPNMDDMMGTKSNNLPWMYPEVLPIIRKTIKRRYEIIPYLNNLTWISHLRAEPSNTPLQYGEFASDGKLYTEEILNGFDYWMGTGKLLVAGAYADGVRNRTIYFPRSSEGDKTPYIRVSSQFKEVYDAGSTAEIEIPLEEFAIFARAGAIIPIGKDHNTVTSKKGIARTTVDGADVKLVEDGGVVSLDDWRRVEIYPPPAGHSIESTFIGNGGWIEDDGVSLKPALTIVSVEYKVAGGKIAVIASFKEHAYETAWGKELWVVLPYGDEREVEGAEEVVERDGRKAFRVTVS